MRSARVMVLRRWAMTNEVRSWSRGGEAALDQVLALAVEVAGRLVEDHDPRVGGAAGDREALAVWPPLSRTRSPITVS